MVGAASLFVVRVLDGGDFFFFFNIAVGGSGVLHLGKATSKGGL